MLSTQSCLLSTRSSFGSLQTFSKGVLAFRKGESCGLCLPAVSSRLGLEDTGADKKHAVLVSRPGSHVLLPLSNLRQNASSKVATFSHFIAVTYCGGKRGFNTRISTVGPLASAGNKLKVF